MGKMYTPDEDTPMGTEPCQMGSPKYSTVGMAESFFTKMGATFTKEPCTEATPEMLNKALVD